MSEFDEDKAAEIAIKLADIHNETGVESFYSVLTGEGTDSAIVVCYEVIHFDTVEEAQNAVKSMQENNDGQQEFNFDEDPSDGNTIH